MAAQRQGKMANLINYRMKVTLADTRQLVGQMLAFDKHMNLVLADTEEFRRTRKKQTKPTAPGSVATPATDEEARRTLGLVIVRGTTIISLSVDGPPPTDPAARLGAGAAGPAGGAPATLSAGPGISRPAGRGASLQGPAVGVGGPAFGFPPAGGPPGGPPGGFGGPPGFGRGGPPGFPPGGGPPGFQPPQGFGGGPPGGGRGFPPPGFGGR